MTHRFNAILFAATLLSWGACLATELSIPTPTAKLTGPDARYQMVVTAKTDRARDVSREATYEASPAGLVEVDASGFITPKKDGTATVTAKFADAPPVSLTLTVEKVATEPTLSFPNEIAPLLTRNGCNTGDCHARLGGQNGFQLSLLGFEPDKDYIYLTQEARGRRIFPAAPESSLLLLKATGEIPHGGGARMDKGTPDYDLLCRWIAQGLPYSSEKDPVLDRIEVFPRDRVVKPGSAQQLAVTAIFTDGSTRDITRAAQFEPNQKEMAASTAHGLVTFRDQPGNTAIMVRFKDRVDVFTATIPLGREVAQLPEPRNVVDQEVFERLRVLGLPPSPETPDHAFLRRVTLDIAGRLPSLEETQAFLASTDANKRAQKIDSLLETTDYADYFAGKWSAILRNKSGGSLDKISRDTYGFHAWIRANLIENKPYDQFVTELLTASGQTGENPAAWWYRVVTDPKDQMADIAQVFLGIRMQCAQCHHHPYEKWSQGDYYGFAAFFSTIGRKEVYKLPEEEIVYHKRIPAEIMNPGINQKVKPRPLDGAELNIPAERDPRVELAAWMRSKENPFFARMLVNRYWKHFFGRGLVEPEDDLRVTNPATHPQLMQDLSAQFVKNGFDLKDLIRTICNSHAYQLQSTPNDANGSDQQNYARFYPRRLPAEVMLDSINDVLGAANSFNRRPEGSRAISLPDDNANMESEFLIMFGRPQMDSACECERTGDANLGQSLHLINSDTIQQKLTLSTGRAAQLAKAKERSDADRITEAYLRALCRPPVPEELQVAEAQLAKKRAISAADPAKLPLEQAEREAFEDILWVLVNTKEFLFNL